MKTHHLAALPRRFLAAFCLLLASGFAAPAQTTSSNSVPLVTIQATDQLGTWTGDPAAFTVYRAGNPEPALNVYCCISGTASNGVDYKAVGHFVSLASGVMSNNIAIIPINLGQTSIKTVTVELCPSPLMIPVNYLIGSPARATVYLTPVGVTNLPPAVTVVSPANGAVFYSPTNISLLARAADPDGTVTNVEFFAGTMDLGRAFMVVLDPPGVNGVTGPVYFLNWQNVPTNVYSLTAVAADDGGAMSTSAPVNITVLTGPPPTNLPPVVRITSPPNAAVFRAPVNIPIFAHAYDPDGFVTSVEFFAGGSSLGLGRRVTAVPPPGPVQPLYRVIEPTNYWELVWTNAPLGTNTGLTAKATDNGGAFTVSDAVPVTILPAPPPPTNRPPRVSIVATDPVAIEGTNCWVWPGPASPVATWSNWFASNVIFSRLFTNCGPKDATFTLFRYGATNDDLNVAYSIGGTATNGVDYVALPGLVTLPAGECRATITIQTLDDGPPDLNSTVVLRLLPGTNYLTGFPASAGAVILESRSPRPVTGLMPGGVFNLSASGPDGAWFHVEYSTDLTQWTPVCTNQVVNGGIDFVDPDAPTNAPRFYRAVPEAGPPPQ